MARVGVGHFWDGNVLFLEDGDADPLLFQPFGELDLFIETAPQEELEKINHEAGGGSPEVVFAAPLAKALGMSISARINHEGASP